MTASVDPLDQRVRDSLADGDAAGAVTIVIDTLGGELLGYLWLAARSWGDGDELFSLLAERLWRGLPGFRFDCSLRTWCYVIARNIVRTAGSRARRDHERMPLANAPELLERVEAIRTSTRAQVDRAAFARLELLREALDEDDRTLLLLRVDRRMAWRDIAAVFASDGEDVDQLAARLRKRFERVKERLRERMKSDP